MDMQLIWKEIRMNKNSWSEKPKEKQTCGLDMRIISNRSYRNIWRALWNGFICLRIEALTGCCEPSSDCGLRNGLHYGL